MLIVVFADDSTCALFFAHFSPSISWFTIISEKKTPLRLYILGHVLNTRHPSFPLCTLCVGISVMVLELWNLVSNTANYLPCPVTFSDCLACNGWFQDVKKWANHAAVFGFVFWKVMVQNQHILVDCLESYHNFTPLVDQATWKLGVLGVARWIYRLFN